jgi:hypothetical protein
MPISSNQSRVAAMAWVIALCAGCSGSSGSNSGKSCLRGLYDCLDASGECLLVTDAQGQVTVTWPSGATVAGPVGLAVFEAKSASGEACFSLTHDGQDIVIQSGGKTYRVRRGGGQTLVTCPDGKTETHPYTEFPSDQPGIDPEVFLDCRVGGICNTQEDCAAGQVCCDHQCLSLPRCPGTCDVDADCGPGNRCCEHLCTSLPYCNLPCASDANCDDGLFCNGAEKCQNYRCRPGEAVSCADNQDCTVDSCNESTDRCDHRPDDSRCAAEHICDPAQGCIRAIHCSGAAECADSDPCTAEECQNHLCAFSPVPGCCHIDADCDDGRFCNGAEKCQQNACQAGAPPACDDNIGCTDDTCHAESDECRHTPNDAACSAPQVCHPEQGCVDPPQCADDEFEENDASRTATPIEHPSPDAPYMATLCPEDPDWFRVSDDAGKGFFGAIAFSAQQGKLAVHVRDSSQQEIPDALMETEGSVVIMVEGHQPADYFIEIQSSTSLPLPYTMIVMLIE